MNLNRIARTSQVVPPPTTSPFTLDQNGVIISEPWLAWLHRTVYPVLTLVPDIYQLLAAQTEGFPSWDAAIQAAIDANRSDGHTHDFEPQIQQVIVAMSFAQALPDFEPQIRQLIETLCRLPAQELLVALEQLQYALVPRVEIPANVSGELDDLRQRIAVIREFSSHASSHQNGGGDEVIFIAPAYAFAAIPASRQVLGGQVAVTDSTTAVWGAVIAGGGANTVLAWWNGANWTVTGK